MNNSYGERFKKLVELDAISIRILDGIRYKDEDLSVKSGAILAFSGLMIATSIVQLSTSKGSLVYIPKDFTFLTSINSLGLIFLFVSSLISLFGLISSGKYSNDVKEALIQFDDYVITKTKKIKIATIFCLFGTSLVLISLLIVLGKAVFGY